jgi:hypothetical protein
LTTQATLSVLPVSEMSKGHKHICVIEFPNEVPDIFVSVPLFDETLQDGIQVGFCEKADFESIKTSLLQQFKGERTIE